METTTDLTPAELARRLCEAFLIPSIAIPAADWHHKYREVNRAAGVLVGAVMCGMDCEATLRATRTRLADHLGGGDTYKALEKRVGEVSQALTLA